jgi:hypothetical protein
MDLDDVIGDLLADVGRRALPRSRRAQGCARVFFGLLMFGLGLVGAWHTTGYDASLAFRLAGVALFLAMAAFGLFNVVLLRRWRWPGCLFVLAFVGLFVASILFGG